MSKGDTTIRIDMEVAGASSVKMTAADVFKSLESGSKKATSTEAAEAKKRLADAKAAKKEEVRIARRAEDDKRWAQREAAREEKWLNHEALREKKRLEIRAEEGKRRSIRETAAETKRIAREQERDSKRRMREEARDAKALANQKGMMGGLLGRGLWAGAMGIAGYAGVAGVTQLASGVSDSVDEIEKKQAELERVITPLTSLGDNVNRMGEMRTDVIGLGATMGKSNQEIAAFLESLESLSNTMAPEVLAELKSESLQLTELTGGDLQTNMRMLAKTNEIYGDSFKDINHEQNKLFKTQQDADVPMEEMAYRMPELMASAKQLGFTFDEVASGVITTTIALGRSEGAFTGLRNVFAAMEESEKKGIKLTGSFADKLDQLKEAADSGKISLLDLFGRDPLAAGGALLERSETVRENVAMLEKMDPSIDTVGEKIKTKFTDPRYTKGRLYDLDQALIENGPNLAGSSGVGTNVMRFNENWRAGQLSGYERGLGRFGSWFTGLGAALGSETLLREGEDVRLANTPEGSPIRDSLLRKQFEDQKKRELEWLDVNVGMATNYTMSAKDMPEYKAIEARQFVPEEASQKQPSLEKANSIAAGIDESNKILREIRDGLRPPGANMKPGGSKANAEETL